MAEDAKSAHMLLHQLLAMQAIAIKLTPKTAELEFGVRSLVRDLNHLHRLALLQLEAAEQQESSVELPRATVDQVKKSTVCVLGHSMGADRVRCSRCGQPAARERALT